MLRDVRMCSGRLSVVESWKCSWVVLNSLCSGILIRQVERGDLTVQDCVSLNAYTFINITRHNTNNINVSV